MSIEFTTTLPAESTENGYFTIATRRDGGFTEVKAQHLPFFGSLEDAKKWFFDTITDVYQDKTSFQDDPIELGDTSYRYDVYLDTLVYVDSE